MNKLISHVGEVSFCSVSYISFFIQNAQTSHHSTPAGKTRTFAKTVDIPRAAYNFRFFASSSLHHTTECSQMDHMGCLNYTIRSPVGVGG